MRPVLRRRSKPSPPGARVIDKTGLTGRYDLELYVAVDHSNAGVMHCGDVLPDAPPLAEAVEKQLGLKLEKTQMMVDVIVVDHLDRTPVEN